MTPRGLEWGKLEEAIVKVDTLWVIMERISQAADGPDFIEVPGSGRRQYVGPPKVDIPNIIREEVARVQPSLRTVQSARDHQLRGVQDTLPKAVRFTEDVPIDPEIL